MGRKRIPLEQRFWTKVDRRGDDECWPWKGAGAPGYGRISRGAPLRRSLPGAHVVAYELAVGPVPDGKQIDHLCRNPNCVNPAHLEPVSCAENLRRSNEATGKRGARTHCPAGHPYGEANTYLARGEYGFRRMCKACARLRSKARNAAKVPHWEQVVDPQRAMADEERKAAAEAARIEHHREIGRASGVARKAKYAAMEKPQCSVEGCLRLAQAYKGGPCNMHKLRERRARS